MNSLLQLLERIAGALEQLASRHATETVDVSGAAQLLHVTTRAIYARHQRGQMPRPLPGRKLVWRKVDLLNGT